MDSFIKRFLCRGLPTGRVFLTNGVTSRLSGGHRHCYCSKLSSLCNDLKVAGMKSESSMKNFHRHHSKNIKIEEISLPQTHLNLNNNFKKRALLKPQCALNKLRVAFYRSWDPDMVEEQRKNSNLPIASGPVRLEDFEKGLQKVADNIVNYFKSLKTHKTFLTGRERILLYKDMNDEAEAYNKSNYNAYREAEVKDGKQYILPENSHYHDKVMSKVMAMQEQVKLAFPGEIQERYDSWKIVVLDHPGYGNATANASPSIWISKHMIDNSNEDQLAFIIGHEMSHIYMKHFLETISLTDFYKGFILTMMGLTEKVFPTWPIYKKEFAVFYLQSELFKVFPERFTHEYEADRLGILLADMAGYDPKEGSTFFTSSYLNKVNPSGCLGNALYSSVLVDDELKPEDNPSLGEIKPWMASYLCKVERYGQYHPSIQERFQTVSKIIDEMEVMKLLPSIEELELASKREAEKNKGDA